MHGIDEKVRAYAHAKGIRQPTLERWLKWDEADRNALFDLAEALKLGENQLRDFMDWLEEIAVRDGVAIRGVLEGESIAGIAENARLGRGDKLKRIKEEVRRLRFPRLSRVEDAIQRRIRELKLPAGIKVVVPPGLEGGTLHVELRAASQQELERLVSSLAQAAGRDNVSEIFALLHGKTPPE